MRNYTLIINPFLSFCFGFTLAVLFTALYYESIVTIMLTPDANYFDRLFFAAKYYGMDTIGAVALACLFNWIIQLIAWFFDFGNESYGWVISGTIISSLYGTFIALMMGI